MLSPMGLCVANRNKIPCLSPREISFRIYSLIRKGVSKLGGVAIKGLSDEGWGYPKVIQGGKKNIKLT
jgi:hypothetical protein